MICCLHILNHEMDCIDCIKISYCLSIFLFLLSVSIRLLTLYRISSWSLLPYSLSLFLPAHPSTDSFQILFDVIYRFPPLNCLYLLPWLCLCMNTPHCLFSILFFFNPPSLLYHNLRKLSFTSFLFLFLFFFLLLFLFLTPFFLACYVLLSLSCSTLLFLSLFLSTDSLFIFPSISTITLSALSCSSTILHYYRHLPY